MPKHEAIVTFTATADVRVFVDVPEGATTREIEALFDKACDLAPRPTTWDNIEPEYVMWAIGDEPNPAPPDLTMTTPAPECWIEIDGHRWVTDGHCALREDSAMPTEFGVGGWRGDPQSWLDETCHDWNDIVSGLPDLIRDDDGYEAPDNKRTFHRRFAPVLRQGTVQVRIGLNTRARVQVNGETVALVMPWLCHCDADKEFAVTADGRPA